MTQFQTIGLSDLHHPHQSLTTTIHNQTKPDHQSQPNQKEKKNRKQNHKPPSPMTTKSKSKSKPSLAADDAIPFDFVFRSLWIKSPKSRTLNRNQQSYQLQDRKSSNGEREERETCGRD